MVSQAEIARHLGVTRMQACRLVKQGCPTTTLAAALQWRVDNPPRRQPTNRTAPEPDLKKVVEKVKINPRAKTKPAKAAPEPAKAKSKPVKPVKAPPPVAPPPADNASLPPPPPPSKTGDSLLDALNNSIYVADRAFEEYMAACAKNSPQRSSRLSEHNKAMDGRLKAEKAYREELERRGVLVDKAVILQTARQAIEAVLRRLKRLPPEVGPQCNPSDPLLATTVLTREVTAVILTGKKEIDGLRSAT